MSSERARPVLPGTGTTDYARYMRTDALLALQRNPDEWVHPTSCCSRSRTRVMSCC